MMAELHPRILVTRPVAQAAGQSELLRQQGANPVELPLLEIIPTAEDDSGYPLLKSRVMDLDLYHKIIFISANAVIQGMELIDQFWPQLPIGIEWLAIGQQTANKLADYGIAAQQPEQGYDSESLLQLEQLQHVENQRILIMRGQGGRTTLAEQLEQRGAKVEYADLYQRRAPDYTSEQISSTIGTDMPAGILLTSGEALSNFTDLIGQYSLQQLLCCLIVVPSERIARIAKDLGYTRVIIAKGPDNRSMAETVLSNIDTDDRP
ncbi:uroporphyrinogen-III synthase [Amphritea balenae]|uniref:Uroporphyrinogen-III synthase n=1 Tax=Amphritea balenae TaxID=452629 RepID=A0A3P1SJF3_9GAMM|nr:uroporphyrinogen-III synthase [Amphritea balenae]RRC97421.1 uroporphyrinogen-III synthase [Amphritea balenae]